MTVTRFLVVSFAPVNLVGVKLQEDLETLAYEGWELVCFRTERTAIFRKQVEEWTNDF